MNLQLKHLACYLPYGLNVICGLNRGGESTFIMTGISNRMYGGKIKVEMISLKSNRDSEHCGIDKIKPILRPLSDLTKDIEHNEEKFVPVERILNEVFHSHWDDEYYRHYEPDISIGITVINKPTGRIIYFIDYNKMYSTRYDIMQWLFKHHFDVFGLIDKGLAINKNK